MQEKTVRRLGSDKSIAVDVRIIAATNRDLRAEVAAGRCREDLYYRLATGVIRLPPLRERQGDLTPLIDHFLAAGRADRPAELPDAHELDEAVRCDAAGQRAADDGTLLAFWMERDDGQDHAG